MIQEAKMEIAYFPGCTLKTKAIGLDDSVIDEFEVRRRAPAGSLSRQ